jgi:diaminopimelate epimerase
VGLLPIAFTKMSGAGNTFVLASALPTSAWGDFEKQIGLSRAEFAKLICDRVLGVGTDGLLLLEPGRDSYDYTWDFYNSDGSSAEMCGNAARCATRYCYEVLEGKDRAHFKFLTGAGEVNAVVLGNGEIRVQMPECKWLQKEISLANNTSTEKFAFVNSGVPHLVQKLYNIVDAAPLKEMARASRHHHDIQPNGANVTFFSPEAADKIKAVTFERGVEDFTLACGTGAVAAAFVHHAQSKAESIEVTMPGGRMKVIFAPGEKRPYLQGDAVFVGDFKYSLEVFL